MYKGLNFIYIDYKNNKLSIAFSIGTDINNLPDIIPSDSYNYEFNDEVINTESTITVEEKQQQTIEKYNNRNNTEQQKLNNILFNFQKNIDEKYYGGAYFGDDIKNNPQLYILITDINIKPISSDVQNNKFHITFFKGTNVDDLYKLIPEDSCTYGFSDE